MATVLFARPADTSAYAAGDVIGTDTASTAAMQFVGLGPAAGGNILITTVKLELDITAVISGMTSFRLYLYGSAPPSALGDNAAFDIPAGDRGSFIGYVDLGTPVDLGSTLYVQTDAVNRHITPPSGDVWGYLVTIGAYTPAASSVFKVTLHAVAL